MWKALKMGLKNDIMDVISTDHAPHHKDEKKRPFAEAPFGITGLETSVALTMTEPGTQRISDSYADGRKNEPIIRQRS